MWSCGSHLRLLAFGGIKKSYRSQLFAQGFIQGVRIQIIRYAPFGGPVQIKLDRAMLVLDRALLEQMIWEPA